MRRVGGSFVLVLVVLAACEAGPSKGVGDGEGAADVVVADDLGNAGFHTSVREPDALEADTNGYADEVSGFTPEPESDPPIWSDHATLRASNIGPTQVQLDFDTGNFHTGPREPEDASGIAGYGLFVDHATSPHATIGTNRRQFVHLEGIEPDTTYHFQVQAEDIWGNWSVNGPTVTVKTQCASYWEDRCPPTWPADATIEVTAAYGTTVVVEWTAAEDNMRVAAYRLLRDGAIVDPQGGVPRYEFTTEGDDTSAVVRDMVVGASVRFVVEVRDNVSFDYGGGWVPGPEMDYVLPADLPDPSCHTDCAGGVFCGEPWGAGLYVAIDVPVPCEVSEAEGWSGIERICTLGEAPTIGCELGCAPGRDLCTQDAERLDALLPSTEPDASAVLSLDQTDGLTLSAPDTGALLIQLGDLGSCSGEPLQEGYALYALDLPLEHVIVPTEGERTLAAAELTYGCLFARELTYVYGAAVLTLRFDDGTRAQIAWAPSGIGESWLSPDRPGPAVGVNLWTDAPLPASGQAQACP